MLFYRAAAFDQDNDIVIGGWDTHSLARCGACMFNDAVAFDQDLGGWAVNAVERMVYMFSGAAASARRHASRGRKATDETDDQRSLW